MARRQRFGTILEKKPSEIGEVKRYLIHSKENYFQNNCDICKFVKMNLKINCSQRIGASLAVCSNPADGNFTTQLTLVQCT